MHARIESLRDANATVHGERLLEPKSVARFYEGRQFEPVWTSPDRVEQVIRAIRDSEKQGLAPADYHLAAIQSLNQSAAGDSAAELEVLLTDAVAGLADDVRYGHTRPSALHPTWNVDPREGAPPFDQVIAQIASSPDAASAIAATAPEHFIYRGLVGALDQLRTIEASGGWPVVPASTRAIKPGAVDARIPIVRARLAKSGELMTSAASDSSRRYDASLVAAVKLFQARHRLNPDGVVGKNTIEAMNVPVAARIEQVRVNLERARWVLSGLQGDFLLINLPAFKTYLIKDGKNVWESRIQVGQEGRKTPSFRSTLKSVVFNPDWTVPPTILEEDILPGMRKGDDVLAKKNLEVFDAHNRTIDPSSIDWRSASAASFPYTLRQPPGPDNALGRVKLQFPNRYSIYLHDTPHKSMFGAEQRTFSSGCIRVENVLQLAALPLEGQWTRTRIAQALSTTETKEVSLARPLPIVIVYWTVSVGAQGEIRYAQDVYHLDGAVSEALGGRRGG